VTSARSTALQTAAAIAIVALVAALYRPVLGYGWLALDDQYGVATNPGIRDFSLRGLRFLFFHDQRDWRWFPLSYASFALDHALFGLAPGAVHRTNLLIHLANTVLVFALVRALTRDAIAAAATSLLFGIHPLQVESVAWVSSRKTLLFFLFFLLAIFAYLGYARAAPARRGRAAAWLAASVGLFLASLTAKPTGVTLPAVLLLVDAVREPELVRRPLAFARRRVPEKLAYLLPVAFAFEMTQRLSRPSPFGRDFGYGPLEQLAIVGHNVAFYVVKALAPTDLAVFYPLPHRSTPGLPLHYWAFALLAIVLVGACVASWRRWRWVSFGLAWYLVTVLPNAALPVLLHDPPLVAADRYFYQSALGLFLVAGVAASAAWRRNSGLMRAAIALAAAAIVAALLVASRRHVLDFRDTIPLYEETVRTHPSDAFYYRLAIEYADAGRTASAYRALELAESAPDQVFFGDLFGFQMRISDLYRRKGDFAKAAEFLARAIAASPNALEPAPTSTPLAFRYLAELYDRAGDREGADAARAKAATAAVDPSAFFESTWFTMAPDAAFDLLERRVREAPDDAVAWYFLGRGLALERESDRAAECLRRAKQLGFPP
jgi:tetratricopeptide (TPR) repeat protein